MKKTLLTLFCAFTTLILGAQTAKTYTDNLVVTINGNSTDPQSTLVDVDFLEDNYINFNLKNFILTVEGESLYVGNIFISNLFLHEVENYQLFKYNGNLKISPGNMPGVGEESWIGPSLGNIPLALTGKISGDKLYVSIDINMQNSLGQIIYVKFGTDFAPIKELGTTFFTSSIAMSITGQSFANHEYTATLTELSNGEYNLELPNLIIYDGDTPVEAVGTMKINAISVSDRVNNGTYYKELSYGGEVHFEAGNIEGFEDRWALAGLSLYANFKGKIVAGNLFFSVDIVANDMFFDIIFGSDPLPVEIVGEPDVYNDKLFVTINENMTSPMDAKVEVSFLSNGGINFTLKNFTMVLEGLSMYVGNINIENLSLFQGHGYQYFNYTGSLNISAGQEEGVSEDDWIGPLLGAIPLRLRGRITEDRLYVSIDIDMESLGQIVYVQFGSEIESRISSPRVLPVDANHVYDLSGRRVRNGVKGIYIKNGKKIIR